MPSLYLMGALALAVGAGAALGVHQNTTAPAPVAVAVVAGPLSAEPETCAGAALYIATDEPPGEQLQVCQAGAYYPALSLGGSGALALQNGSLDIVTSVVPFKAAANDWTGRNQFQDLRLAPANAASCANAQNDLGRLALDTSDAGNSKVKLCGMQAGKLQWLTPYLIPAGANAWQ